MSAAPAPAATATVAARTGASPDHGRGVPRSSHSAASPSPSTPRVHCRRRTVRLQGSPRSCTAPRDSTRRHPAGSSSVTPNSPRSTRRAGQTRRDRIGFIFQAFNPHPDPDGQGERPATLLSIAGRQPDPAWFDQVIDTVGLRERLSHCPTELLGRPTAAHVAWRAGAGVATRHHLRRRTDRQSRLQVQPRDPR